MTESEAAEIIHYEAKRQGEPLTMDVCHSIAKRLFATPHLDLKPGDIARNHRQRYDGDPETL